MPDENVANKMQGIPMDDLIAAPLKAACDSQYKLAQSSLEFIKNIGFQEGDTTKGANLIKFKLERPVETPESIDKHELEVQAPLLGLVPIPCLLVEDVEIDFQMEITASTSSTDTTSKDASVDADLKLGLFSKSEVKVHGKVSSSKENTRSTNQTAKYQVHVSAKQQPPTEGLSRLMDIIATCTAPLSVG